MSDWPLHIVAWSSLVVDKDIGFACHTGGTTCVGCSAEKGEPHGANEFAAVCWRLRSRQTSRLNFIAWCHAKARHPLTDPAAAATAQAWRDAMIDDMRQHDMLDRDVFKALMPGVAARVDDGAAHLQQFLHLNEGWDGKGIAPALLASINDCVVKTGGFKDPLFGSAEPTNSEIQAREIASQEQPS